MTSLLLPSNTVQSYEKSAVDMRRVVSMIMGGGRGDRLFPLTTSRCKPAMCYGGAYRLIDIPISNAINSGCQKIYIITQFLSHSLHRHILETYRPGTFYSGFIDILSVEEKPEARNWLQGTADAVRQNIHYLRDISADYVLVLSGDQLYQMDFNKMLSFAYETDADVVVASLPVHESEATRLGILQVDERQFITSFAEKPQSKAELDDLRLSTDQLSQLDILNEDNKCFLGSMGIYLFKRQALIDLLQGDPREDFGKHLIPTQVSKGNIATYIHQGYWEDIGTVGTFYQANMALNSANPPLNCYDEQWRICSQEVSLPGTRLSHVQMEQVMLCKGSVIEAKTITRSIIGPRSHIKKDTAIFDSYLMGNDNYAFCGHIGENCTIRKAIIDKQVNIGKNVQLVNHKNLSYYDSNLVYVRDGIIVVPRGVTIPDGFVF